MSQNFSRTQYHSIKYVKFNYSLNILLDLVPNNYFETDAKNHLNYIYAILAKVMQIILCNIQLV